MHIFHCATRIQTHVCIYGNVLLISSMQFVNYKKKEENRELKIFHAMQQLYGSTYCRAAKYRDIRSILPGIFDGHAHTHDIYYVARDV